MEQNQREGDNRKSYGLVKAKGFGFVYENGVPFFPFGTTCYAWIYQPKEIREKTLKTLKKSPFNKVRMCIFPKDMIYNEEEPTYFPYKKDKNGNWLVGDPDPEFWRVLEESLEALCRLGIEADLILFHPYDRWGFSELSKEQSLLHIRYCVSRLANFPNVWWSLANEYDLMPNRTEKDWDDYGKEIRKADIEGHLCSIHNCFQIYPKTDWMTHVSVQSADTKSALELRERYQLPVIFDECGYEGDIPFDWGNLSGFELTHRFWMGCVRGGYVSHGETIENKDNRLWWSKGGSLRGECVPRIAFLKNLLAELVEGETPAPFLWEISEDPNGKKQEGADTPFAKAMMRLDEGERLHRIYEMLPMMLEGRNWRLQYLGRSVQKSLEIETPGDGNYTVELLDVWKMERTCICKEFSGRKRVRLWGKEGTAVLLRKCDGGEKKSC